MNPYEILELTSGASAEEVKAAYHRLAKQWHPDKFVGPAKIEAETRFRQLAEAFGMLKGMTRNESPQAPPPSSTPVSATDMHISLDTEPAPRERTVDDWFNDARAAFEGKDYQKALGLVHYAIRLDAGKPESHALLAKLVALTSGDKKAESRALEAALRLNPKDVETTIQLAQLYQSVGMHARATSLWEVARRMAPGHPVFSARKENEPAPKGGGLGAQWADLLANIRNWARRIKGGGRA